MNISIRCNFCFFEEYVREVLNKNIYFTLFASKGGGANNLWLYYAWCCKFMNFQFFHFWHWNLNCGKLFINSDPLFTSTGHRRKYEGLVIYWENKENTAVCHDWLWLLKTITINLHQSMKRKKNQGYQFFRFLFA